MKPRHVVSTMAALLMGTMAATVAGQPLTSPGAHRNGVVDLGEYRIGPEDKLQISVWQNEAMSREVAVRPDGMISLPLINDVKVAGLTPMELRDLLLTKLAAYMPNPEVSVIVMDVQSFKVAVIGEVAQQGRYELKSRTTVLDVLAMARGLTQFASRSRIVILRQDGQAVKRIPFNYNKVIVPGGEEENLPLQPGDIILVP